MSQSENSVRLQNQQVPQEMVNGTTTRSPFFRFVTPLPTSSTIAHRLVAEDVALLHGRHVAVEEVQVGAADGGGGDPHDGVARVLDLRDRDGVDADVALAVPAECLHVMSLGNSRSFQGLRVQTISRNLKSDAIWLTG